MSSINVCQPWTGYGEEVNAILETMQPLNDHQAASSSPDAVPTRAEAAPLPKISATLDVPAISQAASVKARADQAQIRGTLPLVPGTPCSPQGHAPGTNDPRPPPERSTTARRTAYRDLSPGFDDVKNRLRSAQEDSDRLLSLLVLPPPAYSLSCSGDGQKIKGSKKCCFTCWQPCTKCSCSAEKRAAQVNDPEQAGVCKVRDGAWKMPLRHAEVGTKEEGLQL
ncbi:uncharacterized protein LTR77_009737 [Saxophila tyrrhenica]|uniref:Uncharacterized protein n=1 Tax=Saxophila tyrrhenica TaxID=1690608 RepID=A0AAV9NXD5_9PEZI|nr:hypothetical protein LTR77_009737 [Saxophila tyrrhenica]